MLQKYIESFENDDMKCVLTKIQFACYSGTIVKKYRMGISLNGQVFEGFSAKMSLD